MKPFVKIDRGRTIIQGDSVDVAEVAGGDITPTQQFWSR